jgi:hypothetical protein
LGYVEISLADPQVLAHRHGVANLGDFFSNLAIFLGHLGIRGFLGEILKVSFRAFLV